MKTLNLIVAVVVVGCVGCPEAQSSIDCSKIEAAQSVVMVGKQVKVVMDSEMVADHQEATLAAMAWWNDQLGQEVFVVGQNVKNGDSGWVLLLDVDLIDSTGKLGETAAQTGKATILLLNSMSKDLEVVVIAHELGHVLGLGHSDDEGSLMYEYSHSAAQLELSNESICQIDSL